MKYPDKLSDIPPTQNCQWQEMQSSLIYVINKRPFEMDGRIRSSFQMKYTTRSTCQMKYPDKLSDIPPKIRWCVQAVELGQVFRWSAQLGQLVRWSTLIYPPIIRWHVQMCMSFSDEVFMFCCCIGNMSSCTLSNLCRLLCVVIVVSCCCCPVIVLVPVQLHMNFHSNNNNFT